MAAIGSEGGLRNGWLGGWMDLMLVAVVDTFIGLEERRGEPPLLRTGTGGG